MVQWYSTQGVFLVLEDEKLSAEVAKFCRMKSWNQQGPPHGISQSENEASAEESRAKRWRDMNPDDIVCAPGSSRA